MSFTYFMPFSSMWQPSQDGWETDGICARKVAEAYPEDRRYIAAKWWPVKHEHGRTVRTPEVQEAIADCKRCPVRMECELAGMSAKEGIWGGLLPEERETLRRRVRRQKRAGV